MTNRPHLKPGSALKALKKEAKPDKEFVKNLEFRLIEAFNEKYEQKERAFWRNPFRFKLYFASTLSLLLLTTTSIYAYSSGSIVNGDLLYPVKRGIEDLEKIFISSPEEEVEYFNKMTERRLTELDYLEKTLNPEISKTQEATETYLNYSASKNMEESSITIISNEDERYLETLEAAKTYLDLAEAKVSETSEEERRREYEATILKNKEIYEQKSSENTVDSKYQDHLDLYREEEEGPVDRETENNETTEDNITESTESETREYESSSEITTEKTPLTETESSTATLTESTQTKEDIEIEREYSESNETLTEDELYEKHLELLEGTTENSTESQEERDLETLTDPTTETRR